jgi:hypothetical protein
MTTTVQEINRLEQSLQTALDNRVYRAVKHISRILYDEVDKLEWEVADLSFQYDGQDRMDVECAGFSDYVYFKHEYDAGSVIVPEGMGGRICTERLPDEMPVCDDCHDVQIDLDGKYYEIEVPYEVLGMQ